MRKTIFAITVLLFLSHAPALATTPEVQDKLDSLYVRLLAMKNVPDFDVSPLGEEWIAEAKALHPDSETLLQLMGEYAISGGKETDRTAACRAAYLEGEPFEFKPTPEPERLPAPTRGSAWVWAKDFVKARLTAPKTADFPWTDFSMANPNGGNIWIVKSYVDSKNALGAETRTHFIVTMEYLGREEWKLLKIVFE